MSTVYIFLFAFLCDLQVEETPSLQHRVHIPSSALQRSRGAAPVGSEEDVLLVIALLNSSLFDVSM